MAKYRVTLVTDVVVTGAYEGFSLDRVRQVVEHEVDSYQPRPGVEFEHTTVTEVVTDNEKRV